MTGGGAATGGGSATGGGGASDGGMGGTLAVLAWRTASRFLRPRHSQRNPASCLVSAFETLTDRASSRNARVAVGTLTGARWQGQKGQRRPGSPVVPLDGGGEWVDTNFGRSTGIDTDGCDNGFVSGWPLDGGTGFVRWISPATLASRSPRSIGNRAVNTMAFSSTLFQRRRRRQTSSRSWSSTDRGRTWTQDNWARPSSPTSRGSSDGGVIRRRQLGGAQSTLCRRGPTPGGSPTSARSASSARPRCSATAPSWRSPAAGASRRWARSGWSVSDTGTGDWWGIATATMATGAARRHRAHRRRRVGHPRLAGATTSTGSTSTRLDRHGHHLRPHAPP